MSTSTVTFAARADRGGAMGPVRLLSRWSSPFQRACLVLVVGQVRRRRLGGRRRLWPADRADDLCGSARRSVDQMAKHRAICAVLSVAIPYTWSRSTGASVIAYPLLMALMLGCASIPRLNVVKLRPGILDWLVLAIVLDVGLSETLTGLGYSLLQHEVLNILIPYAGVRLFFTAYPESPQATAKGLPDRRRVGGGIRGLPGGPRGRSGRQARASV